MVELAPPPLQGDDWFRPVEDDALALSSSSSHTRILLPSSGRPPQRRLPGGRPGAATVSAGRPGWAQNRTWSGFVMSGARRAKPERAMTSVKGSSRDEAYTRRVAQCALHDVQDVRWRTGTVWAIQAVKGGGPTEGRAGVPARAPGAGKHMALREPDTGWCVGETGADDPIRVG